MVLGRVVRFTVMSLALGTVVLTSGASQATRKETGIRPPAISPLVGRESPNVAGYGKFDQPIMVQDI